MKLTSSIFSFNTLVARWKFPPALALALAIVLAANVWAYFELQAGRLYTSVPRQMIANAVSDLVREDGVWWLGNSTLAAGVDAERITRASRTTHTVVPLGSATTDISIALAALALGQSEQPPQRIVVFVTKDDLNAEGSRAEVSRKYLQAMTKPGLYDWVAAALPIYSTRYAITDRIREQIIDSTLGKNSSASPTEPAASTIKRRYRELANEIESTMLYNLGRDYSPISMDFGPLTQLAQQTETDIWLVSPPVTASVASWQEKYAEEWPWQRIVDILQAQSREADFRFLNYTELLPSTSEFFKDVYHLNAKGKQAFTDELIRVLGGNEQCIETADEQLCEPAIGAAL